jgi:RNase P subunit RPR2
MEYCPRCRKPVNLNTQIIIVNNSEHTNYYCENCGMTIKSSISRLRKHSGRKKDKANDF